MTTALVTGATAGIGRAFADALAARGDDVVLVARDGARLDTLAAELRDAHHVNATPLAADLVDEAVVWPRSRRACTTRSAPIDLLVNNAGIGTYGNFAELDISREEREIRLNVLALVRLTHAALDDMVKRGRGAIVNISSLAAYQPDPFERDVRRHQGVRPQLHARAPRRGAGYRRAPDGGVSGIHAHGVPRTRRTRARRRFRSSCGRRPTRSSRPRYTISIEGAPSRSPAR